MIELDMKYAQALGAAMCRAGVPQPDSWRDGICWMNKSKENKLAVLSEYFNIVGRMLTDDQLQRLKESKQAA